MQSDATFAAAAVSFFGKLAIIGWAILLAYWCTRRPKVNRRLRNHDGAVERSPFWSKTQPWERR